MLIMMVSIHKLAYLTTKGQSEYDEILYYGLQRKKILVGIGILACLSLGMHLQKIFTLLFFILIITLCSIIVEVLRQKYRKITGGGL